MRIHADPDPVPDQKHCNDIEKCCSLLGGSGLNQPDPYFINIANWTPGLNSLTLS